MCHTNAARPPLPPIVGGSTDEGDLVLAAADGNRFMAYAARAAKATGAGIVVMPDVRGLHPFYKDLARRFAQAGVDAVAIDYFGRTAGLSERPDDFDFRTHIGQTKPETIAADVAAGTAYLRSAAGGAPESVFTVGFCFGGAQSWRQSAAQPDLAGLVHTALGWPGQGREGVGPPRRGPPGADDPPPHLARSGGDHHEHQQEQHRIQREADPDQREDLEPIAHVRPERLRDGELHLRHVRGEAGEQLARVARLEE